MQYLRRADGQLDDVEVHIAAIKNISMETALRRLCGWVFRPQYRPVLLILQLLWQCWQEQVAFHQLICGIPSKG